MPCTPLECAVLLKNSPSLPCLGQRVSVNDGPMGFSVSSNQNPSCVLPAATLCRQNASAELIQKVAGLRSEESIDVSGLVPTPRLPSNTLWRSLPSSAQKKVWP